MLQVGEILAKNMKIMRFDKGWKQHHLAEASGFSLETIKRLETNSHWISAKGVTQLAEAFGCDESDLFLDRDKMHKPSLKEALEVIEFTLSVFKNIPQNYLKLLEGMDWSNPNIETMLQAMSTGFKKKSNKAGQSSAS